MYLSSSFLTLSVDTITISVFLYLSLSKYSLELLNNVLKSPLSDIIISIRKIPIKIPVKYKK